MVAALWPLHTIPYHTILFMGKGGLGIPENGIIRVRWHYSLFNSLRILNNHPDAPIGLANVEVRFKCIHNIFSNFAWANYRSCCLPCSLPPLFPRRLRHLPTGFFHSPLNCHYRMPFLQWGNQPAKTG